MSHLARRIARLEFKFLNDVETNSPTRCEKTDASGACEAFSEVLAARESESPATED